MPEWMGSTLNPDIIMPRADQWKAQWHRVIRWQKRLVNIRRKSQLAELDVNDIDFVISFFQNCYQLRDWVQACHPELSNELSALFSNFEMAACRDICNGFKHKKLTRQSLDSDFTLYRECDYFAKIGDGESPIKYRAAFADGLDVRKFDLFELAERCFQFWQRFVSESLDYCATDVSSFL